VLFGAILMQYLIGANSMVGQSYPLVVKAKVNIGDLPYLQKLNEQGERPVKYHHDNWVENFPRVLSLIRISDALEINLFLEHRFTGKFRPPKSGEKENTMGGIALLTLYSLAIPAAFAEILGHDLKKREVS